MDQAMERLRWGQVVEDCGVAVQDLLNAGRNIDAMRVRLVMLHNLHETISLLTETHKSGRIDPPAVVAAVDAILNKSARTAQVPLVSLGQGDYRRDYFEADVVKAEVKKTEARNWLRELCARMGGTR